MLNPSLTGSSQGIGFGILRGLASAGADVVMHGLVGPKEFEEKVGPIKEEFGVQVGHSNADVRQPREIRSGISSTSIYHCFLEIDPHAFKTLSMNTHYSVHSGLLRAAKKFCIDVASFLRWS